MLLYKDLSDQEKKLARQGALAGLALLNLLLLALVISYGSSAWGEVKGVFGAGKKLEITVAGEGKVSAKPDIARITASVISQNSSLKTAQVANTQKSNAVMSFLREEQVAERDIKTVGYNITPQYRYLRPCPLGSACPAEESARITGYEVRNSFEITVRDLAEAGTILSGLVDAGANAVSGITFTIEEPEARKAEARQNAIADARAKVDRLAHDLGKRVGTITNFSEGGTFPPPIIYAREAGLATGGGVPTIPPGENEILVNVSITYELQ